MLKLTDLHAKVYLHSRDPLHYGDVPDTLPEEILTEKEQVFELTLPDGRIDFIKLGKSFTVRTPAWVVFELEQEKAENEELFIGATNLYFGVWLNGKRIIDRLHGDKFTDPVILPMQAGKNLLAIRVVAGGNSWNLALGATKNEIQYRTMLLNLLLPSETKRNFDAYLESAHSSEWTGQIKRDTEANRMSDAEIIITDKNGKPLPNAEFELKQTESEFLFGANLFPQGQLGEEQNALWEKAFLDLFNIGTLPLVWRDYEPVPGHFRFDASSEPIWRKPALDSVINFAKKNHLAVKGQPLVARWQPEWAPKDHAGLRKAYERYFDALAERYSDAFDILDVENEAMELWRRQTGAPLFTPDFDYVNWAFREAEKRFSKRTLFEINEATAINAPGPAAEYQKWIRISIERGADIRSVGLQFHWFGKDILLHLMKNSAFALPELRKTYLTYTSLSKPLFISEVTVAITFPLGGIPGEEVQAELVEQLYRLWFSLPNMRGILYWNLADGMAFGNEGNAFGGILRSDLSPKPAALKLRKLIKEEWRTNLSGKTDAEGKIRFKGFRGSYVLSLKNRKTPFEFVLDQNGVKKFSSCE